MSITFTAKFDTKKPIKGKDSKCLWFRIQRIKDQLPPDLDRLNGQSLSLRIELTDGAQEVIECDASLAQDVKDPISYFPRYILIGFDVPASDPVVIVKLIYLQAQEVEFQVTVAETGKLPPRVKKGKEPKPYGYFWQYLCNPKNGLFEIPGMAQLLAIEYADYKAISDALTALLGVSSKGSEVSPESFGLWLKKQDKELWERTRGTLQAANKFMLEKSESRASA